MPESTSCNWLKLWSSPSLAGSHNWEADWRNFSGASQENNTPSENWSDEKDDGREQRRREKEIEYVDRLVAGPAGISGCIVGA